MAESNFPHKLDGLIQNQYDDGKSKNTKTVNRRILDKAITSVQKYFHPKVKILTHMDLSNCGILVLPEALCDLVTLQFFKAAHNQLTSVPSSIGLLKDLKKIILSFNKLSTLPSSFAELTVLEYLNLSHNELKEPPHCFQEGNININYLDVSYNKIEKWSVGPMFGFALKFFNCSNNHLKTNPSWLWSDFCRSLEDLDLSFNCFTSPSFMVKTYALWRTGVTVRLKHLDLCHCGLNSNHLNLLHSLKAVQKLNLGNLKIGNEGLHCTKPNFIWQLSFQQLQSTGVLTELYLCGLLLPSLPDDINCLKVLEIFDCQGNRLQWLPDSFSELFKLRRVNFSNNKLLYLPENFGKLSSLEELSLDSNELGDLPKSCSNLLNLKWLDLYDNNFEDFPSCIFSLLSSLYGLDIELNYFDVKSSKILMEHMHLCETLRDAMRRHTQAGAVKIIRRSHGFKASDSSTNDSQSDESSDSESTGSEGNQNDYGENTICTETLDEEDWDLEEGQDDYFDPTCLQSRTVIKMPQRALIINELVLHAGSFLPSDIHPSPSIRANKNPFTPEEGQFDDA